MSTLWPFFRLFARHRGWLGLGALLALVTVVMSIGLMTVAGWFIAASAVAGLTLASALAFDIFRPGAGIRFFAAGRVVSRYLERLATHQATFKVLADLRVWFFEKAIPLAPARLGGFRGGDLLNRITADIDALDNLYLRVLTPSAVALLAAVAVTVFLGLFSPAVAAAAFALMLVAGVVLPAAAQRAGQRAGAAIPDSLAAVRARVVDGVQGLPDLLVYGEVETQRRALAGETAALIARQRRMAAIGAVSTAASGLAANLAVWAVLVVGLGAVAAGEIAGPLLAMMVLAVMAAFEAFAPLPVAWQHLGRTIAAARRLTEVAEAEPAVVDPPSPTPMPEGTGLAVRDLTFRYAPDGPVVLDGVSFDLAAGERLAVLGPSGAGKSSLAQVILRLYDYDGGSIRLDGVELRDLPQARVRRRIGYLSQRSQLFIGTIRDNLLYGDPSADDRALWAALEAAALADFVAGLPEGLDTPLGEGGVGLSGGQARRLALARVYLKDAPILILDEPTEGLDAATEAEVWRALERLMVGRSVLAITHRPQGLNDMDRLLVIERGRI
ncbi:MAG: thiol reductant ABC exporter subunit CydC, partial [Alphaproteobacteria bacterium]|nr:thiol reductant ABC exporter subunit CydC [Alphaproteobacteria bacterium]